MHASTLTTFSDWCFYFGTSGEPGLRRICEIVAQGGMNRMYLRTHEGGLATYPTRVDRTMVGPEVLARYEGYLAYPKSYYRYLSQLDYSVWNAPQLLNEAATDAGLEPALWYTIMEDDHGGSVKSDFILANPHLRCVDRQGNPIDGCLEFWHPEVRDYKTKVVEEIIGHGVKRVLLDLVRRNGTPSADARGFYRYGFTPEIVEAYQTRTGIDPHELDPGSEAWTDWVKHCGQPTTQFIIDTCRLLRSHGVTVDLMVWPVNLHTWMGIDLPAILATGLVDELHIASQSYSYSPADLDHQLDTLRPQTQGGDVKLVPSISAYDGCSVEGLDAYFDAMAERNVEQVVLHESDALLRNRLGGRFRALTRGQRVSQRRLIAQQPDGAVNQRPVAVEGFYKLYVEAGMAADQRSAVSAELDGDCLKLRVTCEERDTTHLRPVPKWDAENFNVLALGVRTFWSPLESVHVFLSPRHTPGDYLHLVVDPAGGTAQESRLNERWRGPWSGAATIEPGQWIAEFRVPLSTIGVADTGPQDVGIQIVRVQSEPIEVSLLYPMTTNVMNPDEFGVLTLQR